MRTPKYRLLILSFLALPALIATVAPLPAAEPALQPFAQHIRRLEDALQYLGQPLPAEVHTRINEAMALPEEHRAVAELQKILDAYVLAIVNINAESRVKVRQGEAKPALVEEGTELFLVKVENEAGVTAPLVAESPNSGPTSLQSRGESEPKMELTMNDVKERWADICDLQSAADGAAPAPASPSSIRSCRCTAAIAGSAPPRLHSTSGRARKISVSATTSWCCSTSRPRMRLRCV